MRPAMCSMLVVLSLTVAVQAAHKKAAPKREAKVTVSPLLPPGEQPDSVVIIEKNDQGAMAWAIMGKPHTVSVEENGQQVQKPDYLAPGVVVIIRDLDERTAENLSVRNGEPQVGGAYIARQEHELEYLGQVDLTKANARLAQEFGIRGQTKKK